MKSYHLTMGAGLGGLVRREHDVPRPGANEVLLRVHAASLNYRELMILQQGVVEVGGSTLPQSLKAVAVGGEIGVIGTVAGGGAAIDANAVFASAATLRVVAAGSRTQLDSVARTMAVNRLRPAIARVFGFDEAPAALAWYAEGRGFGKVAIRVSR
jgi:NADPH:quinone reductase-like Zn-dependent oxidoreductase